MTGCRRSAGLDADGDDADHRAVLVLHQVDRVPLVEERGAILQVGLVQVCNSAWPVRSAAAQVRAAWPPCRKSLTGRRTDAGRCGRFRYGRTAGPCARARTRPRGRRNTCIRSRPGHRCSRSPDGVVHVPTPIVVRSAEAIAQVMPPCADTVWERVGKTLVTTAVLWPPWASCSAARMPAPPPPTMMASKESVRMLAMDHIPQRICTPQTKNANIAMPQTAWKRKRTTVAALPRAIEVR